MAKTYAHYYTRESTSRKKKDNLTPGQMRFDIDQDLLTIVEEAPLPSEQQRLNRTTTPEISRKYWDAFKEFLDASGVFSRTWSLYKQVKKDPSIEELNEQLSDDSLSPEKHAEIEEIKEGVVRREVAMRSKMFCETPDDVFVKAHNDWNKFKSKLNRLIELAAKANVSFALSVEDKREWMLKFVLLDEEHEGSKRRNYYKDKFVERALKSLDKTGYAEPISPIDIEAEYLSWREKNAKRRKKKT